MASKRQPASTVPKVASSPTILLAQQPKVIPSVQQPKATPPPSPPLPALSVQDMKDIMGNAVSQIREEMKDLLEQNKSENREELKDLLQQNKSESREELKDLFEQNKSESKKEMKELLGKNNTILRQDIVAALSGLASVVEKLDSRVEEVTDKVDFLEYKFEDMEKKMEISQDDILMSQYREMEYALRIRGLKEDMNQHLTEMVVNDLAVALNRDKDGLRREVEKIYRVNSWVAKQKNLPRDVVIYFAKRSLRNEIIQAFYNKRFQIAAQDVIILKEIPSKILRNRKDFAFLANELKTRLMPFRWEIPMGIVLSHAGTRYRLNTVAKAKEFCNSVLGAGSSSSMIQKVLDHKEVEQQSEGLGLMVAGKSQIEWSRQTEVKEQRMTRAAHRRKEKEQQKKEVKESSQESVSLPVGGARPKSSATHSSMADLQKSSKMGKGDPKKPRGKMSSYAYFVQTCREEHKKKHPDASVNFSEFSKKCSERWKTMSAKEKGKFEDMAQADKVRYEREIKTYVPPKGESKKKFKDPNAPKMPPSAFFLFCSEYRPKIKGEHPGLSIGDVAKKLGEMWNNTSSEDKHPFEKKAGKLKEKYEKDIAAYRAKEKPDAAKKVAPKPEKSKKKKEEEDDDDDDEEEEEEEEEDDE